MDMAETIRWLLDRVANLEMWLAAAEARLSMVEIGQRPRSPESIPQFPGRSAEIQLIPVHMPLWTHLTADIRVEG